MEQRTIIQEIQERLLEQQDIEYRAFQAKLMPGIELSSIIGVRMPIVRKLAKEFAKREDIALFLQTLPHKYYDENNVHGCILADGKDYEQTIASIDAFLPYVNNWATCDMLKPKVFAKHREQLGRDIDRWLASDAVYTKRFGIGMVMTHFLDEDFDADWMEKISDIRSQEYYINMMLAWFYATALAKQWESALPYLTEHRLSRWVHNKTIQKAIESYRISEEQKALLREIRLK